jgi:hypothetical protein
MSHSISGNSRTAESETEFRSNIVRLTLKIAEEDIQRFIRQDWDQEVIAWKNFSPFSPTISVQLENGVKATPFGS